MSEGRVCSARRPDAPRPKAERAPLGVRQAPCQKAGGNPARKPDAPLRPHPTAPRQLIKQVFRTGSNGASYTGRYEMQTPATVRANAMRVPGSRRGGRGAPRWRRPSGRWRCGPSPRAVGVEEDAAAGCRRRGL